MSERSTEECATCHLPLSWSKENERNTEECIVCHEECYLTGGSLTNLVFDDGMIDGDFMCALCVTRAVLEDERGS